MQRFTVKISFQPGKKLGLVLNDSPVSEPEHHEPESDLYGGDEALINIRGGGSTRQMDDPEPVPDGAEESLSNTGSGGSSLQREFAAEAVAAAKFAQARGRTIPPPGVKKRKRPTRLCVSNNSLIFTFAENLLSSMLTKPKHDANIDTVCKHACDPSNVDTLIEWGRTHLPPITFRGGSNISLESINDESLKFVLTGTIQPWDIVEKIQYNRNAPTKMAKLVPAKGKSKHDKRKRRCRPYFRSDHYTTIHCENKAAADLATILRSPQNYPLYITFKRQIPVSNINRSAGSANSPNCDPPPRKRLKKSESNVGPIKNGMSTKNQQPKDEVICLLDSSDEEEGETNDQANASPQVTMEIPPLFAPPDPYQMPFFDDDFVLTPFGPGKILSSRVERYASSDNHSDATIFNPTIIYSIDLDFGICHVPASQVKPISGTSYTKKTLITYQRVPLNGHDLLRLRPMTYLNDSIVMFYLKYLKTQLDRNNGGKTVTENRGWDDLDGEGIHIFPSFCYTRIKNIMGPGCRNSKMIRTKIWNDLKTWTKGNDIFKKKLLVFPVNESLHWTCVFVCHPGRLVRRYAKDLSKKKENAISLGNATSGSGASLSTTNPTGAVPDKVCSTDMAMKSSGGNTENQSQNNESEATNENSVTANSASMTATAKPSTPKWQCDFCTEARFDDYKDAAAHEKICEKNFDCCIIHFDSGKHFKLHKTTEIAGNIRKYLNACYDSEYASSHPGLSAITTKNMPGFTAAVPQQDNSKDCGVYMLENAERMLQSTPLVDNAFVKMKGTNKKTFFGSNGYDKNVIERKRDDILQLIQTLHRGENKIG